MFEITTTNISVYPNCHYYNSLINTEIYSYTIEYNHKYAGRVKCNLRHRFSEWLKFYEDMKYRYSEELKNVHFPPKRYFNTSQEVLDERFDGIYLFLLELIKYDKIYHDEYFRLFVNS